MAVRESVVIDESLGIALNHYDDGNVALEHRCSRDVLALTLVHPGHPDGAALSCVDCGLIGRVRANQWIGA